jgi:3-hydroxybutyryl-CoA dehydratase
MYDVELNRASAAKVRDIGWSGVKFQLCIVDEAYYVPVRISNHPVFLHVIIFKSKFSDKEKLVLIMEDWVSTISSQRGMWFDEFEVGQRIITPGRTITESDIISFAGLSGDYNQIHTDAEFSSQTLYGKRIAHGLLGLSIASGLAMRTGVLEGTVIAFREINNWKFSLPIFISDTIHAELYIVETKPIPRLGGGSLLIEITVINQRNEVTMKGTWTALVASKPN